MAEGQLIWPVILSGGSGTRLWPKSRTLFPKQFHVLTSEHSLLQEALLRVKNDVMYAKPLVICNEEHRFIVAEQAEEIGMELQDIVLEPEGRNTAPAVAVATALVRSLDPNGLVLVLAADHHIPKVEAFTTAVGLGRVAAANYICTFGITPTCPETGYGYIKRLNQEVSPGVYKIDQFREKPDLPTAKKYVADKSYAWNAGMFLFSAARMQARRTRPPARSAAPARLGACRRQYLRQCQCRRQYQKRHWRSPPTSRIRTAGGPGMSGLSVSDGADRRIPSSDPRHAPAWGSLCPRPPPPPPPLRRRPPPRHLLRAPPRQEELEAHEPTIYPACIEAIAKGTKDQIATTAVQLVGECRLPA